MKVNIGNYTDYTTAYTITNWMIYLGIPEEKVTWIGEWLSHCDQLQSLLDWHNERKKRKIKVHIDDYDVWSMDHTLALIIVPMLEKLKTQKHGSAMVDDEDVPDEYKTKDVHERWEWTLTEILWAFTQVRADDEQADAHLRNRITNGIRLFGKYYFALWD